MPFQAQIRQLVADNKLQKALTELQQEAQRQALTDTLNAVVVLQNKLKKADREAMLTLITSNEHASITAQTAYAILNLLDDFDTQAPPVAQKTILFASANPIDTIHLHNGKEWDTLQEEMERNPAGYTVLNPLGAANRDSLKNAILTHKPTVLHLSGHGLAEGIILENLQSGTAVPVQLDGILSLPEIAASLRCVILNACYSHDQALKLKDLVENTHAATCFIAYAQEIEDTDAILFTQGFYMALANNMSFQSAYLSGCDQIRAEGSGTVVPILMAQ
jgi:Effector-associated domain 11/CHAT domain